MTWTCSCGEEHPHVAQGRALRTARSALHVQDRPFPGVVPAEPEPGPDPAEVAAHALSVARKALVDEPACSPACTICNSGWAYERATIGPCCVCGEPCRSTDPDGRMRHPMCPVSEGEG